MQATLLKLTNRNNTRYVQLMLVVCFLSWIVVAFTTDSPIKNHSGVLKSNFLIFSFIGILLTFKCVNTAKSLTESDTMPGYRAKLKKYTLMTPSIALLGYCEVPIFDILFSEGRFNLLWTAAMLVVPIVGGLTGYLYGLKGAPDKYEKEDEVFGHLCIVLMMAVTAVCVLLMLS